MLLAWQYWPRNASPGVAPPATTRPAIEPSVERTATQAAPPSAAQPLPAAGLPSFLPVEARRTIDLIRRGGPFPNRQDGSVFGNREEHLPRRPRGWYREYTVPTPGLSHRGARRIVTGGNPPRDWYYTSDHYDSFRAFDPGPATGTSP